LAAAERNHPNTIERAVTHALTLSHIIMSTISSRAAGAFTAASLAFLIGCSSEKLTASAPLSTRLAVTTRLQNKPAFILQNLDGRDTQRLHFQNVADPIPGNTDQLTLSDDAVLNIAHPRWSVLGGKVAVVATAAFDQSEVVVFDVGTGRAEVASPNTQIVFGAVDWAPSETSIAYTMSTIFDAGVELFTTNLTTHAVKRLTTGANLSQSAVRWDANGTAVYYSKRVGDANDAAHNSISQVARVTVASSAVDTIRSGIVGQVEEISRSGLWALVVRKRSMGVDTFSADLLRVNLANGTETPLVSGEMIMSAQLTADETRVLVATGIGPAGISVVYDLIELSSGTRARIPGVGGQVNVDVSPRTVFPVD
jgi:Tol biopolymer transport system component